MTGRRALTRGLLAQPAAGDDTLTFTASSTAVNRYGFALRNSGWRLNNYNLNPVVLWMHMDFMPPIGRGRASLRDGQLVNAVTFDRSDPFAVRVEEKYRNGFLNAVSVGFDFVDKTGAQLGNWWSLSPEQIENDAFYDLAEVSAVPVPADPQAVRQKHAYGLLGHELLDLAGEPDAGWTEKMGLLRPPEAPDLSGSLLEQRLAAVEARLVELGQPPAEQAAEGEGDSAGGPGAGVEVPSDAAVLRYCEAFLASPDCTDADRAAVEHLGRLLQTPKGQEMELKDERVLQDFLAAIRL